MSSLTDSRVRHGSKACVDAVHRADYPKFNKCLLSQCEAPEKYGVQLVPEAAAAIKALDAPKNRPAEEDKPVLFPPDGRSGEEAGQVAEKARLFHGAELLRGDDQAGGEPEWRMTAKICT